MYDSEEENDSNYSTVDEYSEEEDPDMEVGGEEGPAIGIDLGTTYCCVAVFRNGSTEVIANDHGNRTMPSTVAFTNVERLVGEAAEMEKVMNPKNVIVNSKRFIGRKFDDPVVSEHKSKYPFKFKEQVGSGRVIFEVIYQQEITNVTPEEVGAALLGKMKKIAESHLGTKVRSAVITVPAYFNDAQRRATQHAGTIAGLKVLRIINEPTAAAMAYGLGKSEAKESGDGNMADKQVLVYDLGGGTMDVSLLEINDSGIIEVKATSGDTLLGGEDFNDALFQHFKREIFVNHRIDIADHPKSEKRLLRACEKLKKDLSFADQTSLELAQLFPGMKNFTLEICQSKFEDICEDKFRSTIQIIENVINDAKISRTDVDEVVLIGGSTRIPKIRKMIKELLPGAKLNSSINPDETVACGAAIQAAILSGDDHSSLEDIVLMDVTPLSLGIVIKGGISHVIIPRNSTIPVQKVHTVHTASHYQKVAAIEVLEGERSLARDNKTLGKFVLKDLPPCPAGAAAGAIDVQFDIDANGVLKVTAWSKESRGNRKSITIDSKERGGMSQKSIEESIERAKLMADVDEREEERILAFNNLRSFCLKIQIENIDVNVLQKINDGLKWIENNSGASKRKIITKHKALKKEIGGEADVIESVAKKPRREDFDLDECMEKANKHKDTENFNEAYQWYLRGFYAAHGNKESKAMKALIVLKIGQVLRLQAEVPGANFVEEGKWLIKGAQWLVFGLKSYKYGVMEQLVIEELGSIKKLLFEQFAPRESIFDSLNYLHNFLRLFNHFDIRICGKKMRDLMITSFRDFLNTATLYLEHKLEKDVVEKETLSHIQSLFEPIERLAALEELQIESSSKDIKSEEFRKFVESSQGVAEAVNLLNEANATFSKTKANINIDIDEKINIAIFMLDNLNSLKKSITDSLKIFCKTKMLKGKIFKVLLSNDDLAKDCFREVVEIGTTQDFSRLPWFMVAVSLYQELRSKQDQAEDEKVKQTRGPILEELKEEIKKLDDCKGLPLAEFIDFLFENFPIKHKKVASKPKVVPGGEKKACIILSALYHPDKVKVADHGEKYKVMCEEIVKRVNFKLGGYKGVD